MKTSKLNSSLCEYSDAYVLVSGTINVFGAGADDVTKTADRKKKTTNI